MKNSTPVRTRSESPNHQSAFRNNFHATEVLLGLVFALAAAPSQAADSPPGKSPSPLEWINGDQPLEYLTELHFTGPNHADLPPITSEGRHMIGRIAGGTASGPKLSGKILPLGEDWAVLRPDGTLDIDVQMLVQTEDGAVIRVKYKGLWHGTKETREKLLKGQDVGPKAYYLRMSPYFSTTSEKYDWLNHTVAIGYGYVQRGVGVRVRVFALK